MKCLVKIILTTLLVQSSGAHRDPALEPLLNSADAVEIITTVATEITTKIIDKDEALMDEMESIRETLTNDDNADDLTPIEKRIRKIGDKTKLMLQDLNTIFRAGLDRVKSTDGSVSAAGLSECAKQILEPIIVLYDEATTAISAIHYMAEEFIGGINMCAHDIPSTRDCVEEAKSQMQKIDKAETFAAEMWGLIATFNTEKAINIACLKNSEKISEEKDYDISS